ncbi:MAG: beta-N-acetylhexosaminidase, partial [Planctomycetota bacterium]
MSIHRPVTLQWNRTATPEHLHAALTCLSGHYPISEDHGALALGFEFDEGVAGATLVIDGRSATIRYGNRPSALRALSGLLAGHREEETVASPFSNLGCMLDCSRNAVMTVDHLRYWLRCLALLGYNRVMLYTEDTYTLEGEPYFGYQRGRYTVEELKAVDRYAADLGIELVGTIQTLGHLQQVLKWNTYAEVKDTEGVLLADEEKTYLLIGKMLDAVSESISSRFIHIGMDETWGLGQGRFLERFGHQSGFEIFNRHLARVVALCKERGLKPMIWSDMYFDMAAGGESWYELTDDVPDAVVRQIPAEVQLVYWDYYHETEAFFSTWIERHRQMKREPVVAGGVWTWFANWHDHRQTVLTMDPCINA